MYQDSFAVISYYVLLLNWPHWQQLVIRASSVGYTVQQTWLASILSAILSHHWNEDKINDQGSDLGHDDLSILARNATFCSAWSIPIYFPCFRHLNSLWLTCVSDELWLLVVSLLWCVSTFEVGCSLTLEQNHKSQHRGMADVHLVLGSSLLAMMWVEFFCGYNLTCTNCTKVPLKTYPLF